ncbi:MAG: Phosphoglycolate phosphatase [Chlamydiia bacterium]|nr:Phosphoglycolate phosphatase [Chlamydiia bacterium]
MIKFLLILIFSFSIYGQSSQKKCIVFDHGGVLRTKNSEKFITFFMDELDIEEPTAQSLYTTFLICKKDYQTDAIFWEALYNQRPSTKDEMSLDTWLIRVEKVKKTSMVEIEGSIQAIERLRTSGHMTAILSNVSEPRADLYRELGYYDGFDVVILSCEVGCEKPHNRIFELFLERVQMSPADCIFIDDKMTNIEAARSIGFEVIHFQSGEQLLSELEERGLITEQ